LNDGSDDGDNDDDGDEYDDDYERERYVPFGCYIYIS